MSISSAIRTLFSWSVRNRFRGLQAKIRNIRIRWVSGKPLPPAVVAQLNEFLYLRPTLNSMLEPSTWCLDSYTLGEDFVEIRGWALTPFDQYSPATFTLNGRPFDEIQYPMAREDVASVFWYRMGSEASAFVCRTKVRPEESISDLFPNGFAELHFCDARSLAPFRSDHGFYPADPTRYDFPDPGAERRLRVHGNTDIGSFLIQGSSAFVKHERSLNKVCGKAFEDFPRILDWGCGCGRLTRYFADRPNCNVKGTDIDKSNVAWCNEHFDFASFETCAIDPPTPYPEKSFDLVFGISVMTHLDERDRASWLGELSRICSDGAIVLLTVQGATALCRTSARTESLLRLRQRGALDVDVSVSAENLSTEPTRYIDCFLLEDYIRHRWSEFFEVLDIIPGYIGNVQDLVILRKKAS
jgi:2-polyprenyl-3-methyl-5-hydroxy-6-metoxy-1,4-benzoquinol methylase